MRWSAQEMAFDIRKHGKEKSKPFVHASRNLLPVRHGASFSQRPKADFGVNFERPLLAFSVIATSKSAPQLSGG